MPLRFIYLCSDQNSGEIVAAQIVPGGNVIKHFSSLLVMDKHHLPIALFSQNSNFLEESLFREFRTIRCSNEVG